MSNDNRQPDVVAYGEYEMPVPGGGKASVAFTLARADAGTVAAAYARKANARAHGRVSLVGYPGAPRYSAIWIQGENSLGITVADPDRGFTDELNRMIAPYLAAFLSDVAPISPTFAAVRTKSGDPEAGP